MSSNRSSLQSIEPRIPLRDSDPRAKIIATAILVVGIVSQSPLRPLEVVGIFALLMFAALIGAAKLNSLLVRTLPAIPIAGAMALFAPLRTLESWTWAGLMQAYVEGWPQVVSLITTAWLCVLAVSLLASLTPASRLFAALDALKAPSALVTLLTFIHRYVDVLRTQIRSMHRSLMSRAPRMSRRRQVYLYGNLAGSLIIRAHDRGERVHSAMLARGYTGRLPTATPMRFTAGDAGIVALSAMTCLALWLYR